MEIENSELVSRLLGDFDSQVEQKVLLGFSMKFLVAAH